MFAFVVNWEENLEWYESSHVRQYFKTIVTCETFEEAVEACVSYFEENYPSEYGPEIQQEESTYVRKKMTELGCHKSYNFGRVLHIITKV